MNLETIRRTIDRIDTSILQLLQKRMEKTRLTKQFKSTVQDTARENEIYEKLHQHADLLLSADFLTKLYALIMAEGRRIQESGQEVIAFQGEHGGFSESACQYWNSTVIPVSCPDFSDVFHGVKAGIYTYGMIPLDNMLGTMIGQINSLMLEIPLYIVGEVQMPLCHCLLAPKGVDYRSLRKVFSHPQALTQCREFLKRNKLEAISYPDTAGAAKMVSERNPGTSAAIAGPLAARYYDLEMISEDIDDEVCQTRFLVLANTPYENDGDKCSILFSITDRSGALFDILEPFSAAGINLTRVDSVPWEVGEYAFFVDFIGNIKDESIKTILQQVEKQTKSYRFLGCYPQKKIDQ